MKKIDLGAVSLSHCNFTKSAHSRRLPSSLLLLCAVCNDLRHEERTYGRPGLTLSTGNLHSCQSKRHGSRWARLWKLFADNAFLLRMPFVSAHIFHDLWMNIYPSSAQRPGNIVAFSSISYNISKYHSLLLCPQIPRYVVWVFDVNAREIFSLRFQQTSLFEPHNTKYIDIFRKI